MQRPSRLAFLALAALSCAPPRIPGTNIPDNKDTREVLQVVEAYSTALQRKDAAAVLALVSPKFFDDAGTPEPGDDLDYARLSEMLPKDLARIESIRLEVVVHDIEVKGDTATAEIFSDSWYRVQTTGGPVPRRDSDVHRMRFERADGKWKIVSGL